MVFPLTIYFNMSEEKESLEKESLPALNVNLPNNIDQEEVLSNLIPDEQLLADYDEIWKDINRDKQDIDEALANFANMVFNEGDASSASKEAFVNLHKLRADQTDKKLKLADLKTRIKLRERDTFPKHLSVHQTNNINRLQKRDLLEDIQKSKKEAKRIDKK